MESKLISYAALSVAIAAVAVTTAYVISGGSGPENDCPTFRMAGSDQIGGPFTLVSETGQTVTEQDVITGPTLVYFGYTFCPDVCPLDTVRNADAIDIMAEQGVTVTPVFISVDHIRDTPETLADFTENLHPDMLGLTGSAEQIREAAAQYRTVYQLQNPEEDPDYFLVNHMTLSYLMTPEDGLVTAFARSLSAEQMAEQALCHLS